MGPGEKKFEIYFNRLPCKPVGSFAPNPVVNNVMWHKRFGHVSIRFLEHIESLNLAKNKILVVGDCTVCPKSRLLEIIFLYLIQEQMLFLSVYIVMFGALLLSYT